MADTYTITDTGREMIGVRTTAQLVEDLRYQLYLPTVTTMGACSQGCGNSARGGGVCKKCLAAEIDKRQGAHHAKHWVIAYAESRGCEMALLAEVEASR